ncbi:MAG: hypothetical protein O2782_17475, partial [bacterium]|nr:hypothetical protein [bacterium]
RHRIGEAFDSDDVHLHVRAVGTQEIEEIRVMRGLDCVYRWPENPTCDPARLRVVWSGARIRGRDRIATWDGHLTLTGGVIRAAEGFAFDSANEGIVEQSARGVSWRSVTSGDEDGVILDIEAAADAILQFRSAITDFDLPLADLAQGPSVHEAGGIGLQVKVEYLPHGSGRDVDFVWHEALPATKGTQPYYVRLAQTDGNRAWSSPCYITGRRPCP